MTLAQGMGWSAQIAWYMWMILSQARCRRLMKVWVKADQGGTHARETGRGGNHSR
jgi:hypothetical protein